MVCQNFFLDERRRNKELRLSDCLRIAWVRDFVGRAAAVVNDSGVAFNVADPPGGHRVMAFVSLASIAAGMTVSAARWLVVDTFHAWTGLSRPTWNDGALNEKLPAFEALVDAHFRYYQFYANMAVALAIVFLIATLGGTLPDATALYWTIAFVCLEALFLVTSRDNLAHYYRRASRLLGEHKRKEVKHVQRSRQTDKARKTERVEAQ